MQISNYEADTKLCHAKAEDVISLCNSNTGVCEGYYIVAFLGDSIQEKRQKQYGLYNVENPLILVNLATGQCRSLPHLSSKVKLETKAYLGFAQ